MTSLNLVVPSHLLYAVACCHSFPNVLNPNTSFPWLRITVSRVAPYAVCKAARTLSNHAVCSGDIDLASPWSPHLRSFRATLSTTPTIESRIRHVRVILPSHACDHASVSCASGSAIHTPCCELHFRFRVFSNAQKDRISAWKDKDQCMLT